MRRMALALIALFAVDGVFFGARLARAYFDRRRVALDKAAGAWLHGHSFDLRGWQELVRERRARGETAYPVLTPRYFQSPARLTAGGRRTVPLAGVADATTIYLNENGRTTIYHSDEYGFHNAFGRHRPGAIDTVVIGDSYAQGCCVAAGENIAERLGERTLNLGMAGAGPLSELAALREYAAPLAPKRVLWLYYEGNDLEDLEREKGDPILRAYLDPRFAQGLRARQREIDQALRSFAEDEIARQPAPLVIPWRELFTLRDLGGLVRPAPPAAPAPRDLPLLTRVFATAARDVRAWGGRLELVYLPEWSDFSVPSAHPERADVLAQARALRIPVHDVRDAFAADADPLRFFPFRQFGHYNAAGYARVAELVSAPAAP